MATPTVSSANFDDLERDLEALLRDHNSSHLNHNPSPFENFNDLNMFRSGSAPPTVEGSRTAYGNLFDNMHSSSPIDEEDEESMRAHPDYLSYYYSNENQNPRLPLPMVNKEDWRASQRFRASGPVGPAGGGGLGGQSPHRFGGIGDRRRNVEFEDRSNSNRELTSLLANHHMGIGSDSLLGLTDFEARRKSITDALQNNMAYQSSLTGNPSRPSPNFPLTGSELLTDPLPARIRSVGPSASNALMGMGRSITPEPQMIRRIPSPCLPPVGVRMNTTSIESEMNDAILGMSSLNVGYNNTVTGLPTRTNDYAAQMLNSPEYLNLNRNQAGSSYHGSVADPVYGQYPQSTNENYLGSLQMDLLPEYQKAYLKSLVAQQKLQQFRTATSTGTSTSNRGFYGRDSSSFGMSTGTGTGYGLASPISGSFLSSLTSQARARQGERMTRAASMRNYGSDATFIDDGFTLSLLEDFKTNKTKSFELSDIIGHVVEFSSDQYGSRFIQQKLETATLEEKNIIFPEIFPHARPLMTDVFGNYVIQKFFEYGTEPQRRQLATQLKGHVLQLTLQMYGCRVIQKALEVVGVDQQTDMVHELEGSIMRCVRDQNGNHVIQKCIECVPQDKIMFIISSFFGHVVELSTHPYGCRVIQRVLEHCDDAETQRIMMAEIMPCIITLAQDQYGNYVIQHVLQHGKPEERSVIITKLAGQIVKMSQQKFASNVVEKCLTFGTQEERQILINEILGTTDENEPLQVMMKDQFANYVVQKVLETCDEANRELILSRIKVHLNALKKYTYGKHIVARVEKLITAGERVSASSAT